MPSVLTTTVPCDGSVAFVNVSVPPSTSVAVSVPVAGVSSLVVLLTSDATGASLAPLMVIVRTAMSVRLPSETV